MNSVLFVFLSLSVSGSILALILLALKSLVKNRLSQTWQYYVWLIVILRFLLPFTPQVSVVGEVIRNIENTSNPPAVVEFDTDLGVNENYTISQTTDIPELSQSQAQKNAEEKKPIQSVYLRDTINNVWILWIAVSLILFVHKLASYRSFVRFVKVGAKRITDTRVLDIYKTRCNAAQMKKQLPLYINEQISSPMLVGIVRPMIVIPPLKASDDEFQHIFHHELTHYKRQDFIYKWIVQILICLHWFNPLVYLIGKQIEKSCELSCDEAVIKHLDEDNRMAYGDALITSLETQGSYSDFVVSITMSENANIVKERLDAIMRFNKQTKWGVAVAVIFATLLFSGGYVLGAYSASDLDNKNKAETISSDVGSDTYSEASELAIPSEFDALKPNILPVLQMFITAYENGEPHGGMDYGKLLAYTSLPEVKTINDFSLSKTERGLWATIPIDAECQLSVLVTNNNGTYGIFGSEIIIEPNSFTAYAMMRGLSFSQVRTLLGGSLSKEDLLTMPVEELAQIFSRLETPSSVDDMGFATLDYVKLLDMSGGNQAYVYVGGEYLGWFVTQAQVVGIPNGPYVMEAESLTVTMQGEAQVVGSFRREVDTLILTVAEESTTLMPTSSFTTSKEIIIANANDREIVKMLEPIDDGSMIRFLLSDYCISYSCRLGFDANGEPLVGEPRLMQQARLVGLG